MFRQISFSRFIVVVSLVLTLDLSAGAKNPVSVTTPYKITAIQAKLFYSDKGTFSRNVLAKPDFGFWNTIIGEGDAEGPSDSTLVIVEVSGKTSEGDVPPTRKIELTAMATGKVLLKRAIEVGIFSHDHKFYAAFWLYGTGCEPVKLTARIVGQTQPSSMSKTIPFACGE